MKRIKFMLAVLVVAAMAMGAAYAAWSDNVTIAGSVNTGDVNMEWTERQGSFGLHPLPRIITPGLVTGSIAQNDTTLTVTVGNLYPGAGKVRFDARMENKGSIPVKFSEAVLNITGGNQDLIDALRADVEVYYYRPWGPWIIKEDLVNVTGIPFNQLAQVLNNSAALKNKVWEPGDRLYFGDPESEEGCIRIWLPADADNATQGQTLEFTLDLQFKQWNQ